jgi:Domain of unknown function (DUF3560)
LATAASECRDGLTTTRTLWEYRAMIDTNHKDTNQQTQDQRPINMITYTASYSPDDDKLRLYASGRLDAETYAEVKAAGFRWAPKQDLFFTSWSPRAEDLATKLAGEIEDEDKSLTGRGQERAERFTDYQEERADEAERARAAVSAIAENIPFGQPILVGHHSERRARKDAEEIEVGMHKAVKLWEHLRIGRAERPGPSLMRNTKNFPPFVPDGSRRLKPIYASNCAIRKKPRSI